MFSQSFLYGPRCSTLSHLWPDRLLLNACYSRWPQINIGTSASRIMQVRCCTASLNQNATERKKRAGKSSKLSICPWRIFLGCLSIGFSGKPKQRWLHQILLQFHMCRQSLQTENPSRKWNNESSHKLKSSSWTVWTVKICIHSPSSLLLSQYNLHRCCTK